MASFEEGRQIEIAQLRARLKEIWGTVYTDRQPITDIQYVVTGPGLGPDRIPARGWKPFKVTQMWGGFDQTTWFKLKVRIPAALQGRRVVALVRAADSSFVPEMTGLTEGGESLAYLNGAPFQGLDRNRDELLLAKRAKGGEPFEILLEACPSTRFDIHHIFAYADLAVMNPVPWDFYWDATVALDVVASLDANFAPRRQMLELLNEAVKSVDLQQMGSAAYPASLAAAQRRLRKGLKAFEHSFGMGKLTLAGHAHIDTAWLWPLRETQRKCSRTFATVLQLMERYPEFHFSCSQPVQYEWMKTHYPAIYAGIKRRVKEGRWELCGAPWVEPDHNVPWGESLIRQYLYGNRWFQKEFGKRSHIAWVPDSFGYNWQLPQIMTKCQLTAFITTKIDWSQFTKFPYSFFLWEGADGTRIPAVMPPLNYNGMVQPDQAIEQWRLFKQKERVEELPFPFGWGDGGGGPTAKMIEHGRRLKNVVGVPKCEFGRLEDCVDRMVAAADATKLPVYRDELYLELHRACQTTQARTKRNNRQCEGLLHDAEFLATLAHLNGGRYDSASFYEAWKIALTNQFHDILPGSSITEVYAQADKDYAHAKAYIAQGQAGALRKLLPQIDTAAREGTPVVVFNTRSWMRSECVVAELASLPKGGVSVLDSGGEALPCQQIGPRTIAFEAEAVPPMGYAVFYVVAGTYEAAPAGSLKVSASGIENDFLRIAFDKSGALRRVYDKIEQREVLAPGARANVLQLFDDRPYLHDAWDFDFNFEEKMWEAGAPSSVEVIEAGPVRAVVRMLRQTGQSTIAQDIVMYAGSPRIDFVTHVDWQEKRTLLKAAFPVDVRASRATYEIQFGAIERNTHRSDARDLARYEVPAQKWADLSEGNYGVSLLNDSKYGYDVHENTLRLSLLRASVDPDPHADEGAHDFTYALLPHAGDWRIETVLHGFELNFPLVAIEAKRSKGALPAAFSLVSIDAENVILDSVKKSEDSDAIVVRAYEAYGQRGKAELSFFRKPKKVTECDFMEENDQKVACTSASIPLYFKPYEIRTFKVVF